jgi:hypothetical protein
MSVDDGKEEFLSELAEILRELEEYDDSASDHIKKSEADIAFVLGIDERDLR